MRREGYWIRLDTGEAFPVFDHAGDLQHVDAVKTGLPEEVLQRIRTIPYSFQDGPARHEILFEAMACGLIRVRGHEDFVCVETTLPLQDIVAALVPFSQIHFGEFTWVKLSRLPHGPYVGFYYKDLAAALVRGDLTSLFPPVVDPLAFLDGVRMITTEDALEKADRLQEVIKAELARGARPLL